MPQNGPSPAPPLVPRPVLDRFLYLVDRLLTRMTAGRCRLFKYYIVAQPVAAGLLPGRRGDSIAVREVLAGDPVLAELGRPAHVIAGRYSQGARCLVATRNGRLAGYLWFVTGGYEEDEIRCRFEPLPQGRRAWDFDVFILEEFRGSLVFPKLWSEAGIRMREQNVERTLSRISAFKPESLLAHGRLGARPLARCAVLKLWRWELMLSSVSPRVAFTSGPRNRPVLQLPS